MQRGFSIDQCLWAEDSGFAFHPETIKLRSLLDPLNSEPQVRCSSVITTGEAVGNPIRIVHPGSIDSRSIDPRMVIGPRFVTKDISLWRVSLAKGSHATMIPPTEITYAYGQD